MKEYESMSREELLQERARLERAYREYQEMGLALNMARGKPSVEQLDLSLPIMDVMYSKAKLSSEDGTDCRNYGELEGIHEARELMAAIMDTEPEKVIVFGNSSLSVMYDTVARNMSFGVYHTKPWSRLDKVKFLCPVPGYDRHFAITELFGIEMINIPMTPEGPDMDLVEQYVNHDEAVKGIWCVPKFSNPDGIVYSDETVRRFARLRPAAPDFRIFWDNAYAVHYLYENDQPAILDILSECEKAGNPDIVYEFASTSKITFPGSGISALATSERNRAAILKQLAVQTIGHDKVNMLRHVRFLKSKAGVLSHMKKQADIIRPKFEMLDELMEAELKSRGLGSWIKPKGGYFISYTAMPGTARRIVGLAKDCGVTMTPAGAPFPYGKDPEDAVIRIAPTFPSLKELETAGNIFTICVRMAAVEKLLQ